MNKHIDDRISAFIDGELESVDAQDLISDMLANDELRARWLRYQLASDVLHRERLQLKGNELLDRVSAALESEPTMLAPRQRRAIPAIFKQVAGMAIAASVAAASVLMIQTSEPVFGPGIARIADNAPASNLTDEKWIRVSGINWTDNRPDVVSRLNAYLVNHNGYSTSVRGILPYAPIVSGGSYTFEATPEDEPAIEYKPEGSSNSR